MAQTPYTSTAIADELVSRLGMEATTDVARMIRHYTNEGLLETIGAVNTGTGRKRLYKEDAILRGAVLLRLNRLGVPVGVMKELFSALKKHLSAKHHGRDLLEVCHKMQHPCLFLTIPDGVGRKGFGAHVREREAFNTAPITVDAIVIQLARYLEK